MWTGEKLASYWGYNDADNRRVYESVLIDWLFCAASYGDENGHNDIV
jgi:hypothetical protein